MCSFQSYDLRARGVRRQEYTGDLGCRPGTTSSRRNATLIEGLGNFAQRLGSVANDLGKRRGKVFSASPRAAF